MTVRDTVSSGQGPAAGVAPAPLHPAPLHPAVAAALARLEQLDGSPAGEHVEVLDAVHRLLQDALASLDGA
jgi:hypothetical protein